jgi:hypothetical protein
VVVIRVAKFADHHDVPELVEEDLGDDPRSPTHVGDKHPDHALRAVPNVVGALVELVGIAELVGEDGRGSEPSDRTDAEAVRELERLGLGELIRREVLGVADEDVLHAHAGGRISRLGKWMAAQEQGEACERNTG